AGLRDLLPRRPLSAHGSAPHRADRTGSAITQTPSLDTRIPHAAAGVSHFNTGRFAIKISPWLSPSKPVSSAERSSNCARTSPATPTAAHPAAPLKPKPRPPRPKAPTASKVRPEPRPTPSAAASCATCSIARTARADLLRPLLIACPHLEPDRAADKLERRPDL